MTSKTKKPTMIKVGNHIIDPTDVACITRISNKNIYVVRLKSQPNMEYPIWVKKHEISDLLDQFNIIVNDEAEENHETK